MNVKILYKTILCVLFLGFLPISSGLAFIPRPPLPPEPTGDFWSDSVAFLEYGGKVATQASSEVSRVQSEAMSLVKGVPELVKNFNPKDMLFNKEKDKPNVATARTIKKAKIADVTNEESVVEAFHTLFLTYPDESIFKKFPGAEEAVKEAYRKKAVEFSNDSMIEMYIAVRQIDERMKQLKAEFDSLSSCYVAGTGGSSSSCQGASPTDEELGIWGNYYKLNVIYDSMLKLAQELTALKAQYEVAQALRNGIEPVMPTDETKNDELSFNYYHAENAAYAQMFSFGSSSLKKADDIAENSKKTKIDGVKITAQIVSHENSAKNSVKQSDLKKDTVTVQSNELTENAAYDQMFISGSSSLKKADNTAKDSKKTKIGGFEISNHNDLAKQSDPKLDIVTAQPNELKSPFSGAGDQFITLAEVNQVYQILSDALTIHNLKQQMPEYRRVFEEHKKIRQLHQKSIEHLKLSEDCVVEYLGRYYADSEKAWLGSGCHYSGLNIVCNSNRPVTAENLKNLLPGDALCTDDAGKICSTYGINSYASRGGLAGWLTSAYKVAKAEKVLEVNEDDRAVELKKDNSGISTSTLEKQESDALAEQNSGTADSAYMKPSDEEKSEEAVREQELVAWQIGAEAAKSVGTDMLSSSPKWGVVKKRYPVWNDEKAFYDQYLAEKYNNMKIYVRDLDLRPVAIQIAKKMSDSLTFRENLIERLTEGKLKAADIRNYNSGVLAKTEEVLAGEQNSAQQMTSVAKAVQKADTEMKKMIQSFDTRLTSLEKDKTSAYEKLDESGVELNDLKKSYNVTFDKKQDAEANIGLQKQMVEISQGRKEKSSGSISSFEYNAEQGIESSNQEIAEAEAEEETIQGQIDSKRDQMDNLKQRLERAKFNIEQAKQNYAADAAKMEYENYQKVEQAEMLRARTPVNISLQGSSSLRQAMGSMKYAHDLQPRILQGIIRTADSSLSDVKEQILQKIEEGYRQIMAMGEDRYDAKNLNKILAIHQQIIEDIQNPDIHLSVSDALISSALPTETIISFAGEIFKEFLKGDICPNDECYHADTAYFVGLNPQKKDFQAPKGVMSSATPPLREIFHFDTVDFENVVKSGENYTTRHEFLSFGQDIPQIWKLILQPKGFVEKDVDVFKILKNESFSEETQGDILMRGGSYPCSVGKYDVDFYKGGFFVSPSRGRYETCKEIKSLSVSAGGYAHIVLNTGDEFSAEYDAPLGNREVSELSLFLRNERGLRFREKILEIVQYYEDLSKEEEPKDDPWEKIYQKALLARNQFSDFLGFVEIENTYQKGVDEMNVKLDEARKTLSEQLVKADYTPKEGFDLADQHTYDEIADVLDKAKNKLVQQAVSRMKSLQPLNSTLEEKIAKNKNIMGALQLDSDELVQLSSNSAGDSELAEKIKTQKVDGEARSKYEKEAEEEFQNNMNNFALPYCVIY